MSTDKELQEDSPYSKIYYYKLKIGSMNYSLSNIPKNISNISKNISRLGFFAGKTAIAASAFLMQVTAASPEEEDPTKNDKNVCRSQYNPPHSFTFMHYEYMSPHGTPYRISNPEFTALYHLEPGPRDYLSFSVRGRYFSEKINEFYADLVKNCHATHNYLKDICYNYDTVQYHFPLNLQNQDPCYGVAVYRPSHMPQDIEFEECLKVPLKTAEDMIHSIEFGSNALMWGVGTLACVATIGISGYCFFSHQKEKKLNTLIREPLKYVNEDRLRKVGIDTLGVKHDYKCPITTMVMDDPVKAEDGITYERKAIEKHFLNSTISPVKGIRINKKLIPNTDLKTKIELYVKNRIYEINVRKLRRKEQDRNTSNTQTTTNVQGDNTTYRRGMR